MLPFRTDHRAGLRKSARKDLQHPAWVDAGDGSSPRSCTMSDVSQTGARLTIENPADVPDEFTLLLTGDGSVRRQCRVMRRIDREIGVQFLNNAPPRRTSPAE
jgi:hypothetical protein